MTRLVGISGSLRKGSYNTALLRFIADELPDGTTLEIVSIGELPLFNQDLEASPPEAVVQFRNALRDADGVVIATPEYNHSVPGVLKNALDWASRPPGEGAINNKPVAILGASPGGIGTARAQAHLHNILVAFGNAIFPHPQVAVARAHEQFADDGTLESEGTRQFLSGFTQKMAAWMDTQHG